MKRRSAWLGMCFLLSVCSFGVGGARKKPDALVLIQKARELSDIRAEGSPPFRLEAEFKLFGLVAGTAEGKYVLIWASPDRVREEISFPGFTQVSVRGKERLWLRRSLSFRPLPVMQLIHTLGFDQAFKPQPGEKTKIVRPRSVKDESLVCVETKLKAWSNELCFDRAEGTLVLERDARSRTEFSDYNRLGSKLFPGSIRLLEDGNLALEVHVTTLREEQNLSDSLFDPPAGSVEWKTCEHQLPPKPLRQPEPPYPESARRARVSGVEVAYILVGSDGNVHNAKILKSIGPGFDVSTIKTLENSWRFKPATCGSDPVPLEVIVEVTFRLW